MTTTDDSIELKPNQVVDLLGSSAEPTPKVIKSKKKRKRWSKKKSVRAVATGPVYETGENATESPLAGEARLDGEPHLDIPAETGLREVAMLSGLVVFTLVVITVCFLVTFSLIRGLIF